MGAVSCYIDHVITFEFVSEFAFVSAFVSCCIRFFHLPTTLGPSTICQSLYQNGFTRQRMRLAAIQRDDLL